MLRPIALLLALTAVFGAEDGDQMLFTDSLGLVIGTYHDEDHRFIGMRADERSSGTAAKATIDTAIAPDDILARERTWAGSRQAKAFRALAWQRSLAEAELAGVEKALAAARTTAPPPAQWLSKETQERYQREMAWKAEQAAIREQEAQKLRKRIAELKEAGAQIDAERRAQLLAEVASERERRRNAAATATVGERSGRDVAPARAAASRADEETAAATRRPEPPTPDEQRMRDEPAAAVQVQPASPPPVPHAEPLPAAAVAAAAPRPERAEPPARAEPAPAPEQEARAKPQAWLAPLVAIAAIAAGGALFLVPVVIAYTRRHRYALPIAIICVVFPLVLCGGYAMGAAGNAPALAGGIAGVLGIVAWLASLVWACMPGQTPPAADTRRLPPAVPAHAPAREPVFAVSPDSGGIPLPSTWTSSGGMTREAPSRPPARAPSPGETTRIRQPPRPR